MGPEPLPVRAQTGPQTSWREVGGARGGVLHTIARALRSVTAAASVPRRLPRDYAARGGEAGGPLRADRATAPAPLNEKSTTRSGIPQDLTRIAPRENRGYRVPCRGRVSPAIEKQGAILCERIQVGCCLTLIVVGAHMVGPDGVDGDQQNIHVTRHAGGQRDEAHVSDGPGQSNISADTVLIDAVVRNVRGARVDGHTGIKLWVDAHPSLANGIAHVTIAHNSFYDLSRAVEVLGNGQNPTVGTVEHVHVANNHIHNSDDDALSMDYAAHVNLSSNQISNAAGDGIHFTNTDHGTIVGNTIDDAEGTCVNLPSGDYWTVSANSIHRCGNTGTGDGIKLGGSYNVIDSNSVHEVEGTGISAAGNSLVSNNILTGETVSCSGTCTQDNNL